MLALAAAALIAPVGWPIDVTGPHLAYSRGDGSRYRLVIDGRDAPVAPSRRPFDVDLGTDARGKLAAVYTRRADSTDVHWLDVGSGRERRVPTAARPDRDETAPSVSRGRVVFVVPGRREDRVYRSRLAGSRVLRLPTPSADPGNAVGVGETELAGDVVAYTGEESQDADTGRGRVWFARGRGRPRQLLSGVNSVNQSSTFFAPQVSSKWVTAGFRHLGDGGTHSRVVRASPARGTVQEAIAPDVPDADYDAGQAQRELQGFGIGSAGAVTSACADVDANEGDVAPDCRVVRAPLEWRTRR